jgi:hypothetical protein
MHISHTVFSSIKPECEFLFENIQELKINFETVINAKIIDTLKIFLDRAKEINICLNVSFQNVSGKLQELKLYLKQVELYFVEKNKLKILEADYFGRFSDFKILNFEPEKIGAIFTDSEQMKAIMDQKISNFSVILDSRIFANLTHLTELKLDGQNLEKLETNSFKYFSNSRFI